MKDPRSTLMPLTRMSHVSRMLDKSSHEALRDLVFFCVSLPLYMHVFLGTCLALGLPFLYVASNFHPILLMRLPYSSTVGHEVLRDLLVPREVGRVHPHHCFGAPVLHDVRHCCISLHVSTQVVYSVR